MELLQLKYFIESARTENFSIVANNHFVPVSSVSASVRKLEKELNCKLFDRYKNKIHLNKNGQKFYDNINTALNLIDSVKDELSSPKVEDLGSINMLIKTKKSSINEKIIEFIKNNKNISFHLIHDYSSTDHSNYDIIIDEQNHYKGFSQKPIYKETIKIIASKNSPLNNKQLTLNDLRPYPFITMSDGSSLNKITKKVCQNAGFNPNIIVESDDTIDIINYIEEGLGISFVSEKITEHYKNNNISNLNVVDFDYKRITYIYLNNNLKVSKAAKMFYEYMDEIMVYK